MKTLILKSAFGIFFLCVICGFSIKAQNQQQQHYYNMGMGVGPVVSISEPYTSLPTKTKSFIAKYFPTATLTEIDKKTLRNIFELKLSNGYELSFYIDGNWLKVEAPNKGSIPVAMLKDLLPNDTFKYICHHKMESSVSEISHNINRGYKVEFNNFYFDTMGKPMVEIKNTK